MEELPMTQEEVKKCPAMEDKNNTLVTQCHATGGILIEEIIVDQNQMESIDMTDFVETKTLKYQEVMPNLVVTQEPMNEQLSMEWEDEQEDIISAAEEDRLTQQFLDGELTFCEYACRFDNDDELETIENEPPRKTSETDEPAKPKRKTPRKKRTLPAVLQGLMGEANLRYARGDIEVASQMCMEIIRQVPSAPEPFHTLSMIYETDQPEKSLQFALIAAHLSPKDAEQWVRLANLSLENGNIRQAITCYSKAIQACPTDVSLYEIRAQLQEQNGDKRAFIKSYSKLVQQMGPEHGELLIKYAKMLAKRYMQENNTELALDAMNNIFTKCPDLVTLEEVNIMIELQIALKHYQTSLDILTKHTNITVEYKEEIREQLDTDETTSHEKTCSSSSRLREIVSCEMPNDVVVDIKAKFLVILIQLNKIDLAKKLLPKLYPEESPEVSGDFFLDVAEAFIEKKEFQSALVLLDSLVKSESFSLAAVWLRHAECWIGCGDVKKAIQSYEVVRKLSPQYIDAKCALAKLYEQKGLYSKAIDVLKQDPNADSLDANMIYRRTLLLLKAKRYEEFFESGMLLMSRHWATIKSKGELITLARATGVRQRLDSLRLYRLSCGNADTEDLPFPEKDNVPDKAEFQLFIKMCKLACEFKKYGLLQRMCFSALTSKKFERRSSRIMFLCLVSCIYNKDSYYGFNMVRDMVRVCQRANSWNLLNIIIQRAEDSRHNRFIMRLIGREDVFSYLHIMHANNCLVSGTYKYALNDYISLFKREPSALLALLIAVTLIQMACQKTFTKKNQLVIQAMGFLKKYSQLRGDDGQQEVNYNFARACHQIGMLPMAVHYYKLVLDSNIPKMLRHNSALLDLKREAAFNLHLIYLQSENHDLARLYLEEYIIV